MKITIHTINYPKLEARSGGYDTVAGAANSPEAAAVMAAALGRHLGPEYGIHLEASRSPRPSLARVLRHLLRPLVQGRIGAPRGVADEDQEVQGRRRKDQEAIGLPRPLQPGHPRRLRRMGDTQSPSRMTKPSDRPSGRSATRMRSAGPSSSGSRTRLVLFWVSPHEFCCSKSSRRRRRSSAGTASSTSCFPGAPAPC